MSWQAGKATSAGQTAYIQQPQDYEGVFVNILRHFGVIPSAERAREELRANRERFYCLRSRTCFQHPSQIDEQLYGSGRVLQLHHHRTSIKGHM